MDLRIIREHLAQAERHLALSDRHIGRQIKIIDELQRDGRPTALALDVLATYRAVTPHTSPPAVSPLGSRTVWRPDAATGRIAHT